MSQLTLKPRARADGSVSLELPPGTARPGEEVEVRVTVNARSRPMTQEEWAAWVYSVCGTVDDDSFVRPPQGELEDREPLS